LQKHCFVAPSRANASHRPWHRPPIRNPKSAIPNRLSGGTRPEDLAVHQTIQRRPQASRWRGVRSPRDSARWPSSRSPIHCSDCQRTPLPTLLQPLIRGPERSRFYFEERQLNLSPEFHVSFTFSACPRSLQPPSEARIGFCGPRYVRCFNEGRVHQGIHGIPEPPPELDGERPVDGKLVATPVCGGLHHDYRLAA
jgi:hypothetical protein